ncbi:MAG: thiamine-phosphate kinase [Myxococcaceae bacterium]
MADSESRLINAFVSGLPHLEPPEGPGDDCAWLPAKHGGFWVKTDAVFDKVHFTCPPFSLEDVGHKALAVNLSDLAAAGATPRFWLCALGIPIGFTVANARALARGMRPLAEQHGLMLTGGNVSRASELSITLQLLGDGGGLTRHGAKPGDALLVSGTLGAAAAGLLYWQSLLDRSRLTRQLRPEPRLELGRLALGKAHAAMDVSDGLLLDTSRMCEASKCGADIESAAVPLAEELQGLSEREALATAMTGGEDYELLLAVPEKHVDALAKKSPVPLTRIGTFSRRKGVRVDGKTVRGAGGYTHL